MKSFIGVVVGGAIGLIALYAVGKMAYQAGHDTAELEHQNSEMRKRLAQLEGTDKDDNRADVEPVDSSEQTETETAPVIRKPSKIGMLMGIRSLLKKKESVIGKLLNHPEAHRIEAFLEGDELKVSVRPKDA